MTNIGALAVLCLRDFEKVGEADTAFLRLLKTLFIFSVFNYPTFPSSQYYNIKQIKHIKHIDDLKLENISFVVGIYRGL